MATQMLVVPMTCCGGLCNRMPCSSRGTIAVLPHSARPNTIPTVMAARKAACSAGCLRCRRSRIRISRLPTITAPRHPSRRIRTSGNCRECRQVCVDQNLQRLGLSRQATAM